ncbi:hypothetical protein DPEC_G00158320 [Dallia pectoralis]|uniref:Uncharacterized protein n=1 Tax=Dallia pectoralis TaxID=75939 RepID=A0ACC2GLG0_DALPE|nr:hypothetical protein DPEC_G00158320 [Dallia pectoralis]
MVSDFSFILGFLNISAMSLLPPPQNVTGVSHNLGAILKWDDPLTLPRTVTYTAGYKHNSMKTFQTVCIGTKERYCDFGELPSVSGSYRFRVRTEIQREHSNWEEILFRLGKQTIIDSPKVTLISKGGATGFIEVNIQDPVLKISSLREAYGTVAYNLRFWKETDKKNVSEIKKTTEQQVKLTALEPNTRYCVQVQIHVPQCETAKEFSDVTCIMSTEKRLSAGLLAISLTVTIPLLFLICCIIYKGKKFLHPKVSLPVHYNKILNNPGSSPLLAWITVPPEEKYDQINAVDEGNTYDQMTCVPEDNLCIMDRGVSMAVNEYYNAVGKNAKCDLPYGNI